MKTLKLGITLFLLFSTMYSQDRIDPTKIFNKLLDTHRYQPINTEYVLGWNWSSPGAKLDSALFCTYYHNLNFEDPIKDLIHGNTKLIVPIKHFYWGPWPVPHITGGRISNRPFQAHSILFDPTLKVDSTINFVPKPYDSSGAVFGFLNKNKVFIYDSTQHPNEDYCRVILRKDSLNTGQKVLALSQVWKNDAMYLLTADDNDTTHLYRSWSSPYDSNDVNGKFLFLVINLKSKENIPASLKDSTILSIKMPYTFRHYTQNNQYYETYDSIKFHSIPQVTSNFNNDTLRIFGSRGDYRGIQRVTDTSSSNNNNSKQWNITGSMLSATSDGSADSSITLKAFFICDSHDTLVNGDLKNNPFLQPENGDHNTFPEFITNIDLEVWYHRPGTGLNLAVKYLMIATPRAMQIYEGNWDSTVIEALHHTDSLLDQHPLSPRIYRFYADDELIPSQWLANRYFNLLVDTIASVESYIKENSPVHYQHALEYKEFWNGDNFTGDYDPSIAVPYIRQSRCNLYNSGIARSPYFNFYYGYAGNCFDQSNQSNFKTFSDTLNSQYETELYYTPTQDFISNRVSLPLRGVDINFLDDMSWPPPYYSIVGIQPLIDKFAQIFYQRRDLLYSDTPWWANIWVCGYMDTNPTQDSTWWEETTWIPKSSEVLRLGINSCIILGSKGLMYWLKTVSQNDQVARGSFINGLQPLIDNVGHQNLPIVTALINSELIGGDFVNMNGDVSGADSIISPSVVDYQTMGISKDRIYFGRKSNRQELFKIHSWIKTNEAELMNLKLSCWFAKGFLSFYSQHPLFGNDSIIKSLISLDTSKLYTKKLWNPETNSIQYSKEAWDSSFFDISLLRKSSDINLTSDTIFIAVLNRRTDPLVRSMDSIAWHIDDEEGSTWYWYKDSSMKFYSTAEFDEFVKYGGNICTVPKNDTIDYGGGRYQYTIYERFRDSTYWQNLFWKRGGVREFVLPFKYAKDPLRPEDYSLLKITELGYDNETLNSQPWRDPKYYHKIDTIIGQDRDLKVRLLPGQAMILRVEILPPPPKIYANLDYSNQRKLIAFPVDSANTYAYDSIRYHLVYHARVDDTMRVFYRRSMPVTGKTDNVPQENIIWPPSVADSLCLSLYYKSDCTSETINRSCDCAYPSIVVRKDSAGVNRAFVVYTCIDNNSLVLVEAKINVDNATASFETPKIIERISGLNIDKYGTPMINAAADGNFYTWSDSTEGIGIGFKSTMTYCFERDDRKYVRFDQYQTALHPSLNSYSRIDQSENQCALVWQEEYMAINPPNPPMIQSEICHSRIDWNPYNRLNLIPFNIAYSMNFVAFNFDSTKSRFISTNNSNHPVVYRGLDDTLIDDRDRISWYDYRDQGIYCDQEPPAFGYQGYKPAIRYITVDTRFNQTEDISIMTAPRKITGSYINPDLTFGAFEGTVENNSEKAMILEFNSYNYCDYDNDENLEIWHVPHGYSTFLSQTSYTPDQLIGLTNARKLTGNGYLSHLAARQFQDGPEDWWKNRRVFMESDSTINDSLKTSAQAFYKGKRDKVAIPFIGFYNYYASSFVSPFYIDGELIRFDVKDMFRTDCRDCRGTIIPDTIKTDWFRVTEANNLDYFIKGFESENVEMLLERKSNRQTVRVNVPRMSDTLMIPIRNLLINGRNNEYRLLFTKLDRFNYYTENLVIMEDPFEPIFRKQGGFDNIIDLGETEYSDPNDYLSIYPNPAEDKVFVTISKPGAGSCRIELISALGQVVLTSSANISCSAEINIQSLSPGLYIIRALLPNGEVLQNSFVLSR